MPRITFHAPDGTARTLDVPDGVSLMHAAVAAGIPGIGGDCGGNAACATCHVHVPPVWRAAAGPADDIELAMLEMARGFRPGASRLACQIKASPLLDGLRVDMPVLPC
ncbi:2Fe-2S iron-sulfur cluster-binding protein [Polymorphobacter sp.]|uniref:2Fe-2S iron-sulfur cluster-binding protein n=1 Tax=Polymorphobacter sp. TaxID=1909290 RepID=UPI003F6FAFAA